MVYLLIILIVIAVIFFVLSKYSKFKDLQGFGGFSVDNTKIIKKLVNAIMPKENSDDYRVKSNMLFVLDSKMTVKTFYFIKLIVLVLGLVLSIGIISTRVYESYSASFDVSKYVSCDISKDEYDVLSKDLTYSNKNDSIEDKKILIRNLSNLNSPHKAAIASSDTDKLYKAICNIHSSLNRVVSISDLLILCLVMLLSWVIPDVVLRKSYSFLSEGSFREYDYLLSYLLVSRNEDTETILRNLTNSSKYYTNFFREYANAYEASSTTAYEFISSRPEFPSLFQQLVRYVDLLDSEGSKNLEVVVSAKKDQNQDDIMEDQMRITRKRVNLVSRLFTISFIVCIFRVLISMIMVYF